MRILILATHFADYSFGLASGFPKDCNVLVVADRKNVASDGACLTGERTNIRLFPISQGRIWNRWWTVLRVCFRALFFRPELVIAHEHIHPHITTIQSILSKLCPLALIIHDPKPHIGRDRDLALKHQKQSLRQRRNASVHLVHGSFCKRLLESNAIESRPILEIVHGPVLVPDTPPSIPAPGLRLLMFGRMEQYKGVEILTAALEILQSQNVEVLAAFVGRGPSLDELAPRLVQLKQVKVHSRFATRDEVIEFFKWSSVVVLPYLEATQSGVIPAAFSNGRGVIASAVGGIPDVALDKEDSVLVPAGSPQALADAISSLASKPEQITQMARKATLAMETRLKWEHTASTILRHFREDGGLTDGGSARS